MLIKTCLYFVSNFTTKIRKHCPKKKVGVVFLNVNYKTKKLPKFNIFSQI